MTSDVLALNCGSSSLKYALFRGESALVRGAVTVGPDGASDHAAAVNALLGELHDRGLDRPNAVGHRLVHGGPDHQQPERVDHSLLLSLERATPFAPLHLPAELLVIKAVASRFGDVPQVVCFDTAFHATLPMLARKYALPAHLFDSGIRRYGFHGLSYEYVVESLGKGVLRRAVLAHLGSGASMVAVRDGIAIDTTMGLTPTGGLVMGTRPGDLDPGLIVYLIEHAGYDERTLDRLLNHESGLYALSGTTADMQRLLRASAGDERAAFAVAAFCYQARKWVGAMAAALGGIDVLVFTGGVGKHAPAVRAEICSGLRHLGVILDSAKNDAGDAIVSGGTSACAVHVLGTDEESMIARHTRRVLAG